PAAYARDMPEGDTIFRTARTLRQALAGKTLRRFEAKRLVARGPRPGTKVIDAEARGKHLLIHFDDGTVLHTHMRMTGSWHVYRAGERWKKPASYARVVMETEDDIVAVCFSAPLVELRRDADASVAHLGPDLCRPDVDLAEVRLRFRRLHPSTELGVALLDQTVASGIGNVYKSEVCFVCHEDPFTPIGELDETRVETLFATAARLLQANLEGFDRVTVGRGLGVYGKQGKRCLRCGTVVRMRHQGEQARSTYWCPGCQTGPHGTNA
ncbi:MAG: nei, partial [Actinomycetia bacterium]|nr:nei [Actinomycetes bacterium]